MKGQTARAPGKLILTGEHAVLQGAPILVAAVDRYAWTSVKQNAHGLPEVLFQLLDFSYAKTLPWKTLQTLKKRLKAHYADFLAGRRSIREVLEKPFELVQYVISELSTLMPFSPAGLEVTTGSDIPSGSGLGSSAAVIVSALFALSKHYRLPFSDADLVMFGQQMENLQHGHSSGVDVRAAVQGGLLWGRLSALERIQPPDPPLSFDVWFTGNPESTTGECVSVSQSFFAAHPERVPLFEKSAEAIHTSLMKGDQDTLIEAVRDNHRLLVDVGVVPSAIQESVKKIEQLGGAAKICGAGSIRGANAGAVWVVGKRSLFSEPLMRDLRSRWSLSPVDEGVHIFNVI